MTSTPNFNCFGFVIDTNLYAGNFERQMCAYLTGEIGDCGVGGEYAEMFNVEFPDSSNLDFGENVSFVQDESGCNRPVSIYPTHGFYNNGYGFAYKDGEEKLALQEYKKYIEKDYKSNPQILEEKLKEFETLKGPPKYPAYNSICIFFYDKPTQDIIDFLKNRVKKFPEVWLVEGCCTKEKIEILGFRIVEFKQEVVEEKV